MSSPASDPSAASENLPASADERVTASADVARHVGGGSIANSSSLGVAAVIAFIALLLFWRLSGFGIWDPWELSTADAARRLAGGEAAPEGALSFSTWLVSLGFRAFHVHEWAGRLPIAIAGLVSVITAYLCGARFVDARTGIYAALIAGTTPLFLFNARTMLGAAPDIAVQSLLGFAALSAVLPAQRTRSRGALTEQLLWLGFSLLVATLAVTTRGALVSALPPLMAAVLTALLERVDGSHARRFAIVVLGLTTLSCIALIVRDGTRDAVEYSRWLGGQASALAPPTFDAVIEEVFHSFAPWSALLPIAMGSLWLSSGAPETENVVAEPERALRYACLIWVATGYGVQTLFSSRYGKDVTYLPVIALALLVALYLRDVERRRTSSWGAAISALLLTGLVLRDFALYPQGPVQGMPIGNFEMPKVWNPVGAWSALLCAFALCAMLGIAADESASARPDFSQPYRFLRSQWRRGIPFRLWLGAFGLGILALCVFGTLAYAIPGRLNMPTLAIKWVRRLLYTPLVLALLFALSQLLLWLFAKLGRQRFLPLLAAGAAIGAYAAQGFLPALSEHFSPRAIYGTFNELAQPGEALGEYKVSGRAAAYYAKEKVIDLNTMSALIDHLAGEGRRWAAFPSEELPEIDHLYRERTHRHLIVADAHNSRVMLAASLPLEHHKDENDLRDAVRTSAPHIQHPISVNFDDKIELLGYDLALPHGTYVGAGEAFTLTWYFRVIHRVPGAYRLFVHIDGEGQRIHGDHDPVDGKYPVRLWDEGDVIVDSQKIDVPASDRGGNYTMLLGFYSGDTRLPIKQGPDEGDSRARIGVLRIQ